MAVIFQAFVLRFGPPDVECKGCQSDPNGVGLPGVISFDQRYRYPRSCHMFLDDDACKTMIPLDCMSLLADLCAIFEDVSSWKRWQ